MKKVYGILGLLLLNSVLISASTVAIKQVPSECISELKRFEARGTAQKKRYRLDQNKKHRRFHKDHKAQEGGKLVYLQDYDLHIEAVITEKQQLRLFLTDDNRSPKVLPNLRVRIGVINSVQRYIYLKPQAELSPHIFEVKLPSSVSGKEVELELLFPKHSHSERLFFDIVNKN